MIDNLLSRPPAIEQHRVLNSLRGVDGNHCGNEVIRRAQQSDINIVFGEPTSGKTTLSGEIIHALHQNEIPTVLLPYDALLQKDKEARGENHREDQHFNRGFFRAALGALQRMKPIGGKVVVETVAVGNTTPKDRCVSGLEQLVRKPRLLYEDIPELDELQNEYSLSVVGLVAAPSQQRARCDLRYHLLHTSPEQIIPMLRKSYNTYVEGIPGISEEELARAIQEAQKHNAQSTHVRQISREEIQYCMPIAQQYGMHALNDIYVPDNLSYTDRRAVQLKALGMNERLRRMGLLPHESMVTLNVDKVPTTWYATSFIQTC